MKWLCIVALCCMQVPAFARIYHIKPHQRVIGKIRFHTVTDGETLADVARRHDLGFDEVLHANPGIDPEHLDTGAILVLPTRFILPDVPHKDIVANTAEMRIYYFETPTKVHTYPVGIGREGWATPEGLMHVIEKRKNPPWYPPKAVREEQAANGIDLPAIVPPGHDNPLGTRSIRLSLPNYLIHGTHDPSGVGQRSSAGCLRMYPEDIEALYPHVKLKMAVNIINKPIKVTRVGKSVYLESHAPLIESKDDKNLGEAAKHFKAPTLEEAMDKVKTHATKRMATYVSMGRVKNALKESLGIPVLIGQGDKAWHWQKLKSNS